MSGLTLEQAHDAMNGIYRDVCATITELGAALFEDVPLSDAEQAIVDGSAGSILPWCRISIKDNLRTQATIGSTDNRRFDNEGILEVEVYTPGGGGRRLDLTITRKIREAFEGVNSGSLWFRNARTAPVGPDGAYWHSNVIVEFCWDEVR